MTLMARTKRAPHHRTKLGDKFSEGSRQIWVRLAKRKLTPTQFELMHGLDRGALFRYMHGDRRPDLGPALFFKRTLGIDPADFNRDPVETFKLPSKAA